MTTKDPLSENERRPPTPRCICRNLAWLFAVPVCGSFYFLFFVLMPSARGGSGPDVGADLRGVLPVFTILVGGVAGSILSIAGMLRRERGAGFVLLFFVLAFVIFIIPK